MKLKNNGFSSLMALGIIAVVIVVGGGYYFFNQPNISQEEESMANKENDSMMMEKDDDQMMDNGESMMDSKSNDHMMDDDTSMMNDNTLFGGEVLAGSKSKLLEFNEVDYNTAIASDKLVVLYFYANWCPTCKVEFPKMQDAFDELNRDDVVGFRVNYKDNETTKEEEALAREFGVPYQHTKVFIKNRKQILKAPDGWNKERYLSEISKAIEA